MATIGNSYFDLIDLYKGQDNKGNTVPVIEMLSQLTPMTEDGLAVECNQGTTHLHSVRTGLPAVTWGKLYQGIPQGKSQKAQVTDTTGFVEGLSQVDTRLLEIAKDPGAVRLGEANAYLEAMAQEAESKLIYGNSAADPEQFMGLAPRFNDLSAANGNQIIDATGSGSDNTSVWFVTWGDNQAQLLYPEGTSAGVTREDKGEQRVLDASGNAYYVKEELFRWHLGVAVKDWRYVSRIANIDVSDLAAGTVDIYKYMRKAYYALQNRRNGAVGRIAIYCNKDVLEALDAEGSNSGASDNFARLRPMEIQGKEVLSYRGIPIRDTDAILNTEAQVT